MSIGTPTTATSRLYSIIWHRQHCYSLFTICCSSSDSNWRRGFGRQPIAKNKDKMIVARLKVDTVEVSLPSHFNFQAHKVTTSRAEQDAVLEARKTSTRQSGSINRALGLSFQSDGKSINIAMDLEFEERLKAVKRCYVRCVVSIHFCRAELVTGKALVFSKRVCLLMQLSFRNCNLFVKSRHSTPISVWSRLGEDHRVNNMSPMLHGHGYANRIWVSKTINFDVLRGLTNALLAAKKPDEVGYFNETLHSQMKMKALTIDFRTTREKIVIDIPASAVDQECPHVIKSIILLSISHGVPTSSLGVLGMPQGHPAESCNSPRSSSRVRWAATGSPLTLLGRDCLGLLWPVEVECSFTFSSLGGRDLILTRGGYSLPLPIADSSLGYGEALEASFGCIWPATELY
ncbi:hypothetical protein RHGRI_020707 [Rhododendron griersonianum]|uniref:Uncharacterized protein n=1 Tax=Rhododendron griersonianum TaxID=479676 RepID=A0AAV6JJB4_9ERIC|nr:hypothetical protein RHGRI_020707 [Rhododendron griersonianum]